jgi:hypothetical protein
VAEALPEDPALNSPDIVDQPAFTAALLRHAAAALATDDHERLYTLLDRAGVSRLGALGRALVLRDSLTFLGDVLRGLPPAQRSAVQDVIHGTLDGNPQAAAPAKSLPAAAVIAWNEGDARSYLAAVARVAEGPASALLAAADAVARMKYPQLFMRPISLQSIQFDHAAGASATSSLHLRRDARTKVVRPEWSAGQANAADSPVLYAKDLHGTGKVVVKAKFSKPAFGVAKSIEVRATEGGVLGSVDAFSLEFSSGTEVTASVPLTHLALQGPSPSDASWRWEYRTGSGPWRFLARSHHRVYCVPKRPREPWDVSAPDLKANPWTAALDFACQASNLSGAANELDGLAAGLCELLNPGGLAPNPFRLAYTVEDAGSAHYSGAGGTFNLTALLERANGGEGEGEKVNCDDCAGLVVTLANLLGCDLYEQYISTSAMHPVIPIGEGQWWANSLGFVASSGSVGDGILTYHKVAWRGDDEDDALVFDITWLLNGFADPDNREQPHPDIRTPWYAYGERFKISGALDYIGRLHPNFGWQLGAKTRRGVS